MSTHVFDPLSPPRNAGARRWLRLGVLSAVALLLHAAILGGADWAWPSTAPPPLPSAAVPVPMQVRVVEPPAPAPAIEPLAVPAAPSPGPAVARAWPAVPPVAVARRVSAVEAAAAMPPVALAQAAPPAAAPVAEPAAEPADGEAIPLYRTRLPPATTLRYEVSRGTLRGTGELVWRPQGEHYALTLDFRLGGLPILSQASTGGFDAAGIAPLRFTDQRPRRGTTAANFQRGGDASGDKITYSGSQGEFALQPGAQDRLSWMLQLAAIVAAEPQLAVPGARVVMQVSGARGDAGVWVFRCAGTESVEARGGAIDALKFVREPREAYDTAVQVWLDPAHDHLPVRATQKSGGSDAGYELRLLERVAPN